MAQRAVIGFGPPSSIFRRPEVRLRHVLFLRAARARPPLGGQWRVSSILNIHMLGLNIGDFDAPSVGLNIQHLLKVHIEFFPFSQHLVKLMLSEHGA